MKIKLSINEKESILSFRSEKEKKSHLDYIFEMILNFREALFKQYSKWEKLQTA